jgi:hypothetical protein
MLKCLYFHLVKLGLIIYNVSFLWLQTFIIFFFLHRDVLPTFTELVCKHFIFNSYYLNLIFLLYWIYFLILMWIRYFNKPLTYILFSVQSLCILNMYFHLLVFHKWCFCVCVCVCVDAVCRKWSKMFCYFSK